jgi:hypothetical protein
MLEIIDLTVVGPVVAIIIFLGIIASLRIGRWFGKRAIARHGATGLPNIGSLAAYQTAGQKGYDWLHKIGFAAIVAFTVYVVLDIEYPRLGWVRLDAVDQLLVNVRAWMK